MSEEKRKNEDTPLYSEQAAAQTGAGCGLMGLLFGMFFGFWLRAQITPAMEEHLQGLFASLRVSTTPFEQFAQCIGAGLGVAIAVSVAGWLLKQFTGEPA